MSTAAPPEVIGDYVIEHEVGRGAFGVVYRAHHRARPDAPLALKIVQGRGDTDRLLLEPAVLSRLEHPCIVGLQDYFLKGNDLVVALEFIDGQDLKTMLDDGHAFTQADVRDMLVQIGSALSVAHSRNVIHRDLKPANVLVTKRADGRLRFVLTDFGIGQVREGIQTEKRTGGTYLFMAPEQLRGRPGNQSDLWALGVVAYRMLAGKMPFPGPTLRDLTNQILYGTLSPPSDAGGVEIDPELEKAVLHLLDRSLQERTASAEELLRELGYAGPPDSVLKGEVTRAKPVAGRSVDRDLQFGIVWRTVVLGLCVLGYLFPGGLVSGMLLVAGLAVFYLGQKDGGWWRGRPLWLNAGALALLALYVVVRYFPTDLAAPGANAQANEAWAQIVREMAAIAPAELITLFIIFAGILGVGFYVLYLFLPAIGGALFASIRRLRREKLLRDLAKQGDAGSERYLDALRAAVDSRFEDVGLHLKYAEALFARGRIEEAAVEARVLLVQDAYNFNANLLLANAYHQLGLFADCVSLCNHYLDVSGYCFEFSELREQCSKREAA